MADVIRKLEAVNIEQEFFAVWTRVTNWNLTLLELQRIQFFPPKNGIEESVSGRSTADRPCNSMVR